MEPILISACLLGAACRYDGGSNPVLSVEALMGRCQLVPVCPEQLGGLPTPREPAERTEGGVVTKTGADVSAQFQRGAEQALHLARIFGCKKAVLKERSPSCGAVFLLSRFPARNMCGAFRGGALRFFARACKTALFIFRVMQYNKLVSAFFFGR